MSAMRTLSPRDRRALQLGALLALPALLYAGAVKPYVASVAAARAEIETQRGLLTRERALIDAAPRLPGASVRWTCRWPSTALRRSTS